MLAFALGILIYETQNQFNSMSSYGNSLIGNNWVFWVQTLSQIFLYFFWRTPLSNFLFESVDTVSRSTYFWIKVKHTKLVLWEAKS